MAKHAIAIKLQFVKPLVTLRRFFYQRSKLRLNKLGHGSLARSAKAFKSL
jgi:hypothetical protein